jgi:hypothetical protein
MQHIIKQDDDWNAILVRIVYMQIRKNNADTDDVRNDMKFRLDKICPPLLLPSSSLPAFKGALSETTASVVSERTASVVVPVVASSVVLVVALTTVAFNSTSNAPSVDPW